MNKLQRSNTLALTFLKSLGIRKPTATQTQMTEKFLTTAMIQEQLYFDLKLTAKEQACLLLAAKGYTNEETAHVLMIKKSTVNTHRINICKKLQCNNITQAVVTGIRFGKIIFDHNF
jgi:DNA-binding CsgD family transcriptional regulator